HSDLVGHRRPVFVLDFGTRRRLWPSRLEMAVPARSRAEHDPCLRRLVLPDRSSSGCRLARAGRTQMARGTPRQRGAHAGDPRADRGPGVALQSARVDPEHRLFWHCRWALFSRFLPAADRQEFWPEQHADRLGDGHPLRRQRDRHGAVGTPFRRPPRAQGAYVDSALGALCWSRACRDYRRSNFENDSDFGGRPWLFCGGRHVLDVADVIPHGGRGGRRHCAHQFNRQFGRLFWPNDHGRWQGPDRKLQWRLAGAGRFRTGRGWTGLRARSRSQPRTAVAIGYPAPNGRRLKDRASGQDTPSPPFSSMKRAISATPLPARREELNSKPPWTVYRRDRARPHLRTASNKLPFPATP